MTTHTGHTPTPWYGDAYGHIWRRPLSELYENGGTLSGDKPVVTVNRGWYGKDEAHYPVGENTAFVVVACNSHDQLLADVRQLREALVAMCEGHTPDWHGGSNEQEGCPSCIANRALAATAKWEEA